MGQGPPTGVDRVELAYLDELLDRDDPVFGLCRTAAGVTLLDRGGLGALRARLRGVLCWGEPDIAARLSRRLSPERRAAEADVRRIGRASVPGRGLPLLLRRLPDPCTYLNVGHSNLTDASLRQIRARMHVAVLVHDTIPLDHPEYQRPGTVEIFHEKMQAVARHADTVICSARATAAEIERHLGPKDMVIAPLGASLPRHTVHDRPKGLDLLTPYFVALGTIEPRKNHALLLDAWEEMARSGDPKPLPQLFIVGRRGWNNEAVFARLDAGVPGVTELGALSDPAMAALLEGARGLLFPSRAEGFGLPPVEAAALGVQPICAPLAIIRETLDSHAVYADADDMYQWLSSIRPLAAEGSAGRDAATRRIWRPERLTWASHFKTVLADL